MATELRPEVLAGLLKELKADEEAVQDAHNQFKAAQVHLDVAERKFAALRDAIADLVGGNPYNRELVEWPRPLTNSRFYGHYRFARMSVGDALLWALAESEHPQSLDQLVKRLVEGGLPTTPRGVNAALMQTKGIEKMGGEGEDALYQLDPLGESQGVITIGR